MTTRLLSSWSLAAALALAGCATRLPAPAAVQRSSPRDPWARVLSGYVDGSGKVDFRGLARRREDLDDAVAALAQASPESSPARFRTRESRLAYYINAYNCLALYAVVSGRRPGRRLRFFRLTTFTVGGDELSLAGIEKRLSALGEPRARFALSCLARGCPRLRREPYDPSGLEKQLDRQTRAFLNDPRNVRVDTDAGVVRLSPLLRRWRAELTRSSPDLRAFVDRYREEPLPAGLGLVFEPFDGAINAQ